MLTAVLAGTLVALVVAPATRALRPGRRRPPAHPDRMPRLNRQAPDCAALLDSIARQVRSGSSLTGAIVGDDDDASSPLHDVVARVAAGSTLGQALAVDAPRDPDWALTVQALSATAHLGGPIAVTLDEAAAVLRERAAARAERVAHAAQARLSARVLTIVPIGFACWSAAASRRTGEVYISGVAGVTCALLGLTLNLVGWRWMRRIIGAA